MSGIVWKLLWLVGMGGNGKDEHVVESVEMASSSTSPE